MDVLELNMDDWRSPEFVKAVRRSLRQSGCVMLRQAVAPQRCQIYGNFLERTFETYRALIARHDIDLAQIEAADSVQGGLHSIAWNLKIGQALPAWFAQANPGFSMFDLVGDLRFHTLMHAIFMGDYDASPAAHARRVSPMADHHLRGWQEPVGLHLDAQYHTPHQFGLNFWVPADDCGEEAPGLQLVAERAETIMAAAGYDQAAVSFDTLKLENINTHAFLRDIDEARIYRPVMAQGDVLVFHNWTLHATHCTPAMDKTRSSFELRFNCRHFAMPD